MKDRLECPQLAKNNDTKVEYVSEFTLLWRLVEGFETETEDEWQTQGEKVYVFCNRGNVFCLLGNYKELVAQWDVWRMSNTYQLN